MSWTETSTGRWERPVGENETFIKLAGEAGIPLEREHWAISSQSTFTLRGVPNITQNQLADVLRKAWVQYRHAQPSMAAFIDGDTMVYEVPDAQDLELWLAETFIVEQPGTTGNDCIADRKPSKYAILHYLPHESKVVLQTSHWRSDGIGILLMLRVYFDCVAKVAAGVAEAITWGEEVSRLSLAVEDAAGLPRDATPQGKAIAEKCMATFGLVANNTGLPYHGDASTMPAGTRVKWIELSEPESSSIFAMAKSRDLSVTSVLHASVAQANFHFSRQGCETKPHVSTIRFGLRHYLPEQYAGAESGAACYTSGKGYGEIMPGHREYARTLVDVMRNMPPPDPDNLPSDMDISSAGIVDHFIEPVHWEGEVEVEVTSCSFGVETITRQTTCFVWTYRGRLNLQIAYNEAYHSERDIEAILHYIKRTTQVELGVSEVSGTNGNG